jgi:hypothetical protein
MSSTKRLASLPAVTTLVEEIQQLSLHDAFELHGIEIYDDGAVYDSIEDIEYDSLLEWAEVQISTTQPKFQKRQSKYTDDE